MGVPTAMAGSAAASASMAAHQARVAECHAVLATFDPKTATVEQQRDFADCVDTLHPDPLTGGETIALKFVIVLCFLGVAIGGWWGSRQGYGVIEGGVGGLFTVLVGGVAIFLAALGIAFLFQ